MPSSNVLVTFSGRDKLSGVMKGISGRFGGLGRAIGNVGQIAGGILAAQTIMSLSKQVIGLGTSAVTAAANFESAFTSVIKTTDGLVDNAGNITELGETIRRGFRDMSKEIPMASTALAEIGANAGQLGIPEQAILSFTDTVAKLAVATNLTAEQAGIDIARLNAVYGVSADDMAGVTEGLGNVITYLGNNFAIFENQILSGAKRIAPAGAVIGMLEEDVLALSTAMGAVGILPELGGTAIQKVLLEMHETVTGAPSDKRTAKLNEFAAVAGKTAEEFKRAWGEDATTVFADFVEGLGARGSQAIGTLEALGLNNERTRLAMLAMAGGSDKVMHAISGAREQMEAGNALAIEAARRFSTFDSKMKLFKNQIKDVAVTLGNTMLPALTKLLEQLAPVVDKFGKDLAPILQDKVIPAITAAASGLIDFFSELQSSGVAGAIGKLMGGLEVPPIVMEAIDRLRGIWEKFGEFWTAQGPGIMSTVTELFTTMKRVILDVASVAADTFLSNFEKIAQWAVDNGPLIESFVSALADGFSALIDAVGNMWREVQPIFGLLVEAVLGFASLVMAVAVGDWAAAWEIMKDNATKSIESIGVVAKTVGGVIGEAASGINAIAGSELFGMLDEVEAKMRSLKEKRKGLAAGALYGTILPEDADRQIAEVTAEIVRLEGVQKQFVGTARSATRIQTDKLLVERKSAMAMAALTTEIASQTTATESLAFSYHAARGGADALAEAQRAIRIAMDEDATAWDLSDTFLRNIDAAKVANAAISDSAKEAAEAAKAAWNSHVSNVKSAMSGVLGQAQGVLGDLGLDFLDDNAGRDLAENARRIAIIASKGFVDQTDSSIQALAAERPELFAQLLESENPGALAQQLLQDFQAGIGVGAIIDKEAAKERVRRILFGQEEMSTLVNELTQEMLAEGNFSKGQIESAIGAAGLGGGGEEGTAALASTAFNDFSGEFLTAAEESGLVDGLLGIMTVSALNADYSAMGNAMWEGLIGAMFESATAEANRSSFFERVINELIGRGIGAVDGSLTDPREGYGYGG